MKSRSFFVYVIVKSLIFLALFVILHFAYSWLPQPWVAVFSGTDESFFQHAKMGFIAYSLLSLGEFLIFRKRIANFDGFVFSRMISAVISPWVMFLTWYLVPALAGKPLPVSLEIVYAIAMTLLLGIVLAIIERDVEKVRFSAIAKALILLLYISSWALFIAFTFKLPWADFFRES